MNHRNLYFARLFLSFGILFFIRQRKPHKSSLIKGFNVAERGGASEREREREREKEEKNIANAARIIRRTPR